MRDVDDKADFLSQILILTIALRFCQIHGIGTQETCRDMFQGHGHRTKCIIDQIPSRVEHHHVGSKTQFHCRPNGQWRPSYIQAL